MSEADLVIVGSGIYGLTTAHTYHRLHPSACILILDTAPSIGGPWAPHRTFPGLKTNNLLGMYEHPDFPMDEQTFGVKKGEHIPAAKMFDYLTAFVKWADIEQFLRLRTTVDVIERNSHGNEGWTLHCSFFSSTNNKDQTVIKAKKLVIAAGVASTSFMPSYPASEKFQPPVVHSKDFAANYSAIVKPNTHTTIIGSGKSAWDIAYACATQTSSTATILIRPNGNGPIWMTPTHVTPFRLWLEKLVHTRFFGFMSPCPWATTTGLEGWLRAIFHRTWIGRKIMAGFWHILGEDAIALNGMDSDPETKKLRPWRGAFEVGNALSIHNYPTSFFDLVKTGKIKVLVDEIASLDAQRQVQLKSGDVLHTDAVVCATGWQKGHKFCFEPPALESDFALPSTSPLTPEETALIKSTEECLYRDFPYLKERDTSRVYHPDPSLRHTQPYTAQSQPYRLYRFMVPPDLYTERSVAFAGALMCLGGFPCAYIQSIWITAWLDGTMPAPMESARSKVLEATYRDTQYCVLRGAMSYGHTLPDIVFDTLPYFDMLLEDLKDVSVDGRRKGGALKECVSSYGPEDYRGVLDARELSTRMIESSMGQYNVSP
ncbi:hypothetical protein PTNB73_03051 [Pyrenophora teres f. teres]|nr:hypothetical protein HRS9122_03810 [Pyrenophora teres f. teres]KAE8871592.1 hypothetical protein PTNB73_03051 [Pyrenophora teres f. teres]